MINIVAAGSGAGHPSCGVGDVNDDGFDDVLVGANGGLIAGRGNPGFAFVIFGMTGPFTDLTVSLDWAAGSHGFMVLGGIAGGAFLSSAQSARGLGDVNGDGIDDFAVTAHFYALPGKDFAGRVWVIFGKTNFTTVDLLPANFGNDGVHYSGSIPNMKLGFCVLPAGDFNGDGIADFLMGAGESDPTINGTFRSNAGEAYLIHGSKTGLATMDLADFVTGSMGVRFIGAAYSDFLGRSLSGVGDINGDGIDDIAISAWNANPPTSPARSNAGIMYVIYGTRVPFTADYDFKFAPTFDMGFSIYGRAPSVRLTMAAPAGDINGDGVADIIVAASEKVADVDIVYGQIAKRTEHVDLLTARVTRFFIPTAEYLNVAGGRDLNGDGVPDILIGSAFNDVVPENNSSITIKSAGTVWMLPGPFSLPTDAPTAAPSTDGSPAPSEVPSEKPSATPSFDPSAMPTVNPSVEPTLKPSAVPSLSPTMDPSANPTMDPTAAPSAFPTLNPSANPSIDPTSAPTPLSTFAPTLLPTMLPTLAPSADSTTRPTVPALKDYELTVDVDQVGRFGIFAIVFIQKLLNYVHIAVQDASSIDPEACASQQDACDLTIKNTMADAVNGATPERVTDIVIEEEEEEGGRSSLRNGVVSRAATTRSVRLKYKITVFDPVYTVNNLRAELMQAAQSGQMDSSLRFYAAQFGAAGLANGTLAVPQVTNAAVQRDASSQLTGVMIALLVVGVIMALGMGLTLLWCGWSFSSQSSQAVPPVDQHRTAELGL